MNLIELLIFAALCAGLAFAGYLFSHRWGLFAGVIPWMAVMTIMIVAPILREIRSWLNRSNR